jgi:hypothetical protein
LTREQRPDNLGFRHDAKKHRFLSLIGCYGKLLSGKKISILEELVAN